MQPSNQDIDISNLSFEQAMSELDSIVKSLESGSVELQSSIVLYRRGTMLRTHCEEMLSKAKLEVEKIVAKGSDVQGLETISFSDAVK